MDGNPSTYNWCNISNIIMPWNCPQCAKKNQAIKNEQPNLILMAQKYLCAFSLIQSPLLNLDTVWAQHRSSHLSWHRQSLISKYSKCRPRLQSAGFRSKRLQAVAASCLLKICSLSGALAQNGEKLGKQIYFLAKYEEEGNKKNTQQQTLLSAATVSAATLVFVDAGASLSRLLIKSDRLLGYSYSWWLFFCCCWVEWLLTLKSWLDQL